MNEWRLIIEFEPADRFDDELWSMSLRDSRGELLESARETHLEDLLTEWVIPALRRDVGQ
jgi:hypothetical protein